MGGRGSLAAVAAAASLLLVSGCAITAAAPLQPGRPIDGQSDATLVAAYYKERWDAATTAVPNLLVPVLEPLRRVPDELWQQAILDCVADYGLDARSRNGFEISELVCEQKFPSENAIELLTTAGDRDAAYRFYNRVMLPCLLIAGKQARPEPSRKGALSGEGFYWRVIDSSAKTMVDRYRLDQCPTYSTPGR